MKQEILLDSLQRSVYVCLDRQCGNQTVALEGTPTHFFPEFFFLASFTLWGRGAARLPDRPPGWGKKNRPKNRH